MLFHAGSLDSQFLNTIIHNCIDLLVVKHKSCFQILIIYGNTYVVFNRQTSEDTISTTVLSNQTDTCVHSINGVLNIHFLSMHVDLTRCHTTDSKNTFHQLGSLSSDQSTKSKDLAFTKLEAYVLERLRMNGTQVFDFKNYVTDLIIFVRIYISQLTTNHLGNDLLCGHLCCRPGSYITTVSHDGNVICNSLDLIHLMGDIDHCYTLTSQIIHNTEQGIYFFVRQRRCRLIEDYDFRLMRDCFCNLNRLHLSDRQRTQLSLRIKIHTNLIQPHFRIFIHFLMIDHFQRTIILGRKSSKEKVLAYASSQNRLKLLMYHGNSFTHSIIRILNINFFSIQIDLSGIHLIDTK